MKEKFSKKGFLLIELLVAIGIVTTALTALVQLEGSLLKVKRVGIDKIAATYLAEEGLEVVRYVRDNAQDWTTFVNKCPSSCRRKVSSGDWDLDSTSGSESLGKFTRTIQLQAVKRTSGVIVTSGGTDDPNSKKIVVTVSWGIPTKSVVLESYVMNLQ